MSIGGGNTKVMEKPEILVEGKYTEDDLRCLESKKVWQTKDIYKIQLRELFEISNARLKGRPGFTQKLNDYIRQKTAPDYRLSGNYVYLPWSGLLLHIVNKRELRDLRTNRTHQLITEEEQEKLGQFSAGVAGLSFGNGIALSLVYSGASDSIKIADADCFETTNLNRVRVGLPSVGEFKANVTAREIYEINPYANIQKFLGGLNDDNIDDFLNGSTKLNVVFDVVDNLALKVKLRLAAKKAKVPVVMLTSLDDSILVDVERYDLGQDLEIFHGLLGSAANDLLSESMTEQVKARYAMQIVGPQVLSQRNLLSLSDIGKTLVSRPHLYGTVSIVCGLAAYIVKRMALGEDMPSLRKLVQFNKILGIASSRDDTPQARDALLEKLLHARAE